MTSSIKVQNWGDTHRIKGQHAGTMDVIIGIGLNVVLNQLIEERVPQDIIDLKSITGKPHQEMSLPAN